jgi:hypothetical protein
VNWGWEPKRWRAFCGLTSFRNVHALTQHGVGALSGLSCQAVGRRMPQCDSTLPGNSTTRLYRTAEPSQEFLHPWRSRPPQGYPKVRKLPGLRVVALWLSKPEERRDPKRHRIVRILATAHPEVAKAENLAQSFRELFRSRNSQGLDRWLQRAMSLGSRTCRDLQLASNVIEAQSPRESPRHGATGKSKDRCTV